MTLLRWPVLLACVLIDAVVLRPLWSSSDIEPGQYRRGYFELFEGQVGLTIDRETSSERFLPNVYYHQNGKISVPPGTSMGVPLASGVAYRVSNTGSGLPPYCVFGRLDPRVDPTQPSEDRHRWSAEHFADGLPPMRLVVAQRLTTRAGQLELEEWDASRTLREDEAWLDALKRDCRLPDDSALLRVGVNGNVLSMQLGACAMEKVLPPDAEERELWMAVVAGREWDFVAREGEAWRLVHQTDRGRMVGAFFAILAKLWLTTAGVGLVAATSASLTVWACHLWSPILAIVCWFALLPAGLFAAGWRAIRRRLARRSSAVQMLAGLSVLGAAAALVGIAVGRSSESSSPPTEDPAQYIRTLGDEQGCLLTGYSAADDTAVRPGTAGTWRYLAESCPRCGGGVVKYARAGVTFPVIRDFLCADPPLFAPGKAVVFLGGSNDDHLFWANEPNPIRWMLTRNPAVVRFLYYYQNPTVARIKEFGRETSAGSLQLMDLQEAMIAEAVRCSARLDSAFWFFQDFMILDVPDGPSAERKTMAERRRAAVEGAGGNFSSLWDAFREQVGVSWFNDVMHFSSIGHRRIADLICRTVQRGAGSTS